MIIFPKTVRRLSALLLLVAFAPVTSLLACPFCGVAPEPLSKRLGKSEIVVLVSWLEVIPAKGDDDESTRFEVLADVTNAKSKLAFKKGERITFPRAYFAKPGDVHLLFGTKTDEFRWDAPLSASDAVYRYLLKAPASDKPSRERLPYFLKHLESSDPVIALDVFSEFSGVPFEDVEPLAKEFPRDKLREWLGSTNRSIGNRLGLYGLMLGLCGDKSDAELLKAKIVKPVEGFPLGRDGMVFGYLLLTSSDGLDWIDKTILKPQDASVSDVVATMQALEVFWTSGKDRVPRERLKASMRLPLNRLDVAERAIANLSRWEDWSAQERLMELYDQDDDQGPRLRQAIIRFLLTAIKASPAKTSSGKSEPPATWALQAQKNLDKLRQRDPRLVKDVERNFERTAE